jgi:hypothetical protein
VVNDFKEIGVKASEATAIANTTNVVRGMASLFKRVKEAAENGLYRLTVPKAEVTDAQCRVLISPAMGYKVEDDGERDDCDKFRPGKNYIINWGK